MKSNACSQIGPKQLGIKEQDHKNISLQLLQWWYPCPWMTRNLLFYGNASCFVKLQTIWNIKHVRYFGKLPINRNLQFSQYTHSVPYFRNLKACLARALMHFLHAFSASEPPPEKLLSCWHHRPQFQHMALDINCYQGSLQRFAS